MKQFSLPCSLYALENGKDMAEAGMVWVQGAVMPSRNAPTSLMNSAFGTRISSCFGADSDCSRCFCIVHEYLPPFSTDVLDHRYVCPDGLDQHFYACIIAWTEGGSRVSVLETIYSHCWIHTARCDGWKAFRPFGSMDAIAHA